MLTSVWDGSPFLGHLVLNVVRLFVSGIHCADVTVVGDVSQVASVFEPRTSHGDVIGGTFTLSLNKDRAINKVFSVPGLFRESVF